MPPREGPLKAIALRLGIARLRLRSWLAGRRLRALQDKLEGKPRPLRRWVYVVSLAVCFAAAVAAAVVSIMAQGVPQLRTLDDRLPSIDEVFILDPDRRDETKLSPGYLYDRAIAAVQSGSAPVLLRMRLEETLLTASHDGEGRVACVKPVKEPGVDFSPRTVPQEEALRQLAAGGFCKPADSWETALKLKLPARRLPGGNNDGGRLLVFEKKTLVADPDSPIPDISAMLPEDVEALGLGKAVYTYTGFYYINEAGTAGYQPLRITVEDTAPRKASQKPPDITGIAYEFYEWEVTQSRVHQFQADDPAAPVNLQPGELRPITDWTQPEDAWFYDADGWVYYGQALEPGVMTPLLLRSFTVWPESPLVQGEARYRLWVRAQSVPFAPQTPAEEKHNAIIHLWHSGAPLGGLGLCSMTNEAAVFASGMLEQ